MPTLAKPVSATSTSVNRRLAATIMAFVNGVKLGRGDVGEGALADAAIFAPFLAEDSGRRLAVRALSTYMGAPYSTQPAVATSDFDRNAGQFLRIRT